MFIDKNAKRINPAAVIKHDGNTYNGNVLMFPEVVAALGITEIADPQPPHDYSDETYFRTEQDEAPYIIYTHKPQEMIDRQNQIKINESSRAYLASTDWYVSRFAETGTPIPEDIKTKRQAARDVVIDLMEVAP